MLRARLVALQEVLEILNDRDVRSTISSENVMQYADFMASVDSIKLRPARWQPVLSRHPLRARQRTPRIARTTIAQAIGQAKIAQGKIAQARPVHAGALPPGKAMWSRCA
jgi:hypothetical protein